MNKKHLIAGGVLLSAIALTGIHGVTVANAATQTDSLPPMIQRLSEKFGLNQDEVKKFVTEDRVAHRAEMQTERKADFTAKLDELVAAGKITAEQKAQIIAKHDELGAKRDALHDQDLSREEMRTQMQAIHTEMTDFLKSIGVTEDIIPMHKGGMMKGEGHGMRKGF